MCYVGRERKRGHLEGLIWNTVLVDALKIYNFQEQIFQRAEEQYCRTCLGAEYIPLGKPIPPERLNRSPRPPAMAG